MNQQAEAENTDHQSSAQNELTQFAKAYEALSKLDQAGRARGIAWLASMLGVSGQVAMTGDVVPQQPEISRHVPKRREGTINTVCARLGVKSCRDLFIAAATHLALYEGKERFSRADWISRAKESKSWKTDYSPQMATTITRLLNSGFVNEVAKDEFAIPDNQLMQLESRLAD